MALPFPHPQASTKSEEVCESRQAATLPLDYPVALAGHVVALLLAQHRELGAHGRQVQAGDLRKTATPALRCDMRSEQ